MTLDSETLRVLKYQSRDSRCDSYKPDTQIYDVVVHKYMKQTEKYGAILTHTEGQTKSAVPRHAVALVTPSQSLQLLSISLP